MSSNNNISPMGAGKGADSRLSEDKLMAYLAGKLAPAEQHEVEQWLAEEGMESDAMEGLQLMQPAERLHSLSRLNHQLRKKVGKSPRRSDRKASAGPNVIVAVLLVLFLIAVAFLVIRYFL
jgi:anti-sigma factor RsiW